MSDDRPVFSAAAARLLASVLDQIIPPRADGKLPGAGAIGVVRYIETHTLRQTPELEAVIKQGLSALAELLGSRSAQDLAALSPPLRSEVLAELEAAAPGFLSSLIFPTYLGYYQQPQVAEGLGLGVHPPHPQGYTVEPDDFDGLLEPVRRRPKFFRHC